MPRKRIPAFFISGNARFAAEPGLIFISSNNSSPLTKFHLESGFYD